MNTWGIQKKRPKKSWTSKKIQTHEFVGKNNKKTDSGGLRPPWVALRATWGVWRPPGRTRRNKYSDPVITNPTPLLPISRKSRSGEERKKEEEEKDFFENYNILLFATKKTTEIGLTMCRKVRFHV